MKLTYKLKEPVKLGSEPEVTELSMTIKGRHMRGYAQPVDGRVPFRELAVIGVQAAEILAAEKFVDEMAADDVAELGTLILGFLVGSRAAGNTLSER